MAILTSNLQEKVAVDDRLAGIVEETARRALLAAGRDGMEVDITFVDDARIQELNRQYRGTDCPTDVLSFPQEEQGPGEPPVVTGPGNFLLGDVVVSLETASRQAEEYGHGLEREVAYLVVHGVLHLLGYDHDTAEEGSRMRAREEKILGGLGLAREG